MSSTGDYDQLLKVLLVGDSGVGKSCMLLRFSDNTYTESYISTIGVDFKISTLNSKGKIVKLQIWDTAGQERFRTITSTYYRGAHAILIVYDISDEESFKNVTFWINEVSKYTGGNAQMLLVGNKADLDDSARKVTYEEGLARAEECGCSFVEVSAKSGAGVNESFVMIAQKVQESIDLASGPLKQGLRLENGSSDSGRGKKRCC